MEKMFKSLRSTRLIFAAGALATLLASTFWWSLFSARLQQGNADQLVDGFLFASRTTFHAAVFPVSHTQLLKWPLFMVLRLFNYSANAYIALTVLVTLVTVGSLAFLLYKIDRRPLVFGLLCVMLASVLVLVPAQVFGGVTTPLNMALPTGRNLEYVVYISTLLLFIKAEGFKTWQWPLATILLSILLTSDQLFTPLGIGGGLLLLVVAYWWQHAALLRVAREWLSGSVAAWIAAKITLWLVGKYVTGIVGDSSSPYGYINSWHNLWPATTFAVKALLLNFGVTTRSGGLAILPAIVNLVIFLSIMWAGWVVLRKLQVSRRSNVATTLSAMLLASTTVALLGYVVTDHPYSADARYVTISLFAGFVVLAAYFRSIQIKPKILMMVGAICLLATLFGVFSVSQHASQTVASDQLQVRNQQIVQALQKHPVELLVGNYWRVVPIKALTPNADQAIAPLRSCFQPIESLRSDAWLKDLRQNSFAYILSVRPDGTPFAPCNVRIVVTKYGKPSSTILISGTQHNPTELLLFYDDGAENTHR